MTVRRAVARSLLLAALAAWAWLAVGARGATSSTATGPSGPTVPSGTTGPSVPTGPSGQTGPAGVAEPKPCTAPKVLLRCPNLIMSAPSQLHIDRTTIPGRALLRATSSVNNRGIGPLEIRARGNGSRGVAGPHGLAVYQAIYDRGHRRHLFRTTARLVYKYVPGERYDHGSAEDASYWKFEHAAAFELWSVDEHLHALSLVRTGPKVDYCLRDLTRSRPSSRSPREAVYPACDTHPRIGADVLGTSVGWSDVYPYEYPEQWINVTGLHGRFAYVQIADPDNLLIESDHRDNVSETYVALPSGRVLGHRAGVSAP